MKKIDEKEEENLKNEEPKDDSSKKNENNDIKNEETPEQKIFALEDKLLRSLAEAENQRRRFDKERQEAFDFGGFNFAKESLSLLDNLDRATNSFKSDESLKENKDLNKIIESIEVIKKDLVSIFKRNNVEAIECINKKFDPNFHQAMLEVESSTQKTGIVVQEIQKGYMMKDRLLRPALVGVAKKREKTPQKEEEK